MSLLSRRRFGLSAGANLAVPSLVRAQARRAPTVVELFTSQLCPGCPVADAYLLELAKRPDLIPLSFSVTHYDRGALKDPFGRVEFNLRQFAYAQAFKRDNAFTPEIVINGHADAPGMATDFVEELLARADLDGPMIRPGQGWVEVGQGWAPPVGADVWVAHYDPRRLLVPIRGIEERALPHINVVRGLYLLGPWNGQPMRYQAPPLEPGLHRAAVVQTAGTGPILGAARG